jgi:hypothetical protein
MEARPPCCHRVEQKNPSPTTTEKGWSTARELRASRTNLDVASVRERRLRRIC